MVRMRAYLPLFLLAAACGSDSKKTVDANNVGSDSGGGIDAKIFMDAPGPVPDMITISGVAASVGVGFMTPQQGVNVQAFLVTDENTPIGTATTDANGAYSLTIATNGVPVDGFIKATKATFVDTYLYPNRPLSADFNQAALKLVTPQTFMTVYAISQVSQDSAKGTIALIVADASMMPVAGATVSSTPAAGAYRYNGGNGIPDKTATSTAADGIAYMLNTDPAAPVSVTATKAGTTFFPHNVKSRPNVLTTTVITP
jgi:hypothetical protein